MTRAKHIQLIHIAKAQLGLDDDTYRAMLKAVSGENVRSSTQLTATGLAKVLQHLQKQGFRIQRRARPATGKQKLIKKIRAQLISLGNLPDSYADGIAKHMFNVERYHWLNNDQLHRLIAALAYQQRRQGAPTK